MRTTRAPDAEIPVVRGGGEAQGASIGHGLKRHVEVAVLDRQFEQLEPQRRFGQLLNRLMFEAMPPASRWTALDRFYRLPEATISRFYASASTWKDRARILVGRPPAGLSWRHLLGAQSVNG